VLHTTDYQASTACTWRDVALTGPAKSSRPWRPRKTRAGPQPAGPGYAGWGTGQLENEIKENVWLTCEADDELIFGHDYGRKWSRALAKLGVDSGAARLRGGPGLVSRFRVRQCLRLGWANFGIE